MVAPPDGRRSSAIFNAHCATWLIEIHVGPTIDNNTIRYSSLMSNAQSSRRINTKSWKAFRVKTVNCVVIYTQLPTSSGWHATIVLLANMNAYMPKPTNSMSATGQVNFCCHGDFSLTRSLEMVYFIMEKQCETDGAVWAALMPESTHYCRY